MQARELITDDIPPLKLSDTAKKVLDWMDEFRLSHLPVVSNRVFLGMVSYMDIIDSSFPKKTIEQIHPNLINASVKEDYHIFDVFKVISENNVTAVAVVDDKANYLGVITNDTLIKKVANMPFVNEPGSIIVLEVNIRDYSLSQIAQIVEGNDAKILNLHINAHTDSTKIEITLKINKEDLSPILQTFNRYNYTVRATYHQHHSNDDLQQRYSEFIHYLNI